MQADVFGAADLSLPVEAGTQNPELGAVDLWSPAAIPGTAGSPPGRERQQPLWISDFRLPILDFRLGTGSNPKSPIQNHVEAGRKRPCSSAVRRMTVFVFSVIIFRIRNALRRSFRLRD